jgi:ATP-dependent Lon protease
LVVAVSSAIKRQSVLAGLAILGDLSIQGNIKAVCTLSEPLQVSMDNGARRALVPLENKRNFLEVSGDIVERVDPVFFSDPLMAAMKALGMNLCCNLSDADLGIWATQEIGVPPAEEPATSDCIQAGLPKRCASKSGTEKSIFKASQLTTQPDGLRTTCFTRCGGAVANPCKSRSGNWAVAPERNSKQS